MIINFQLVNARCIARVTIILAVNVKLGCCIGVQVGWGGSCGVSGGMVWSVLYPYHTRTLLNPTLSIPYLYPTKPYHSLPYLKLTLVYPNLTIPYFTPPYPIPCFTYPKVHFYNFGQVNCHHCIGMLCSDARANVEFVVKWVNGL